MSFPALFDEFGGEAGPAGLVARPDSGAIIALKVYVEEDQIAPVRRAELIQCATPRAPAELHGAVDGPAKSLRERLGERLRQVNQSGQPHAKVPTPSLQARGLLQPNHGYGTYLHRSLSSLEPVAPLDPVASKPSPPNIQNI